VCVQGEREGKRKKQPISTPKATEWSGAWAAGNAHMAKESFPNPALTQALVQHSNSTNTGVPISPQFRENGSN